jgi:hypothetical protein
MVDSRPHGKDILQPKSFVPGHRPIQADSRRDTPISIVIKGKNSRKRPVTGGNRDSRMANQGNRGLRAPEGHLKFDGTAEIRLTHRHLTIYYLYVRLNDDSSTFRHRDQTSSNNSISVDRIKGPSLQRGYAAAVHGLTGSCRALEGVVATVLRG